MGSIDPRNLGIGEMELANRLAFTLEYRYLPDSHRAKFAGHPTGRLVLSHGELIELWKNLPCTFDYSGFKADAAKPQDLMRLSVVRLQEAFAQGLDRVIHDGKLMGTDWGFRIEDIRKDLSI